MVDFITEKNRILSLEKGAEEFSALRKIIAKEKILERDYLFYFLEALFIVGGLAVFGYFLLNAESTFTFILFTIGFSLVASQLSGPFHDAGHTAIFSDKTKNDIVGTICGLPVGMNFFSWKYKHNVHHAHPNEEEVDTDLDIPFFFTKKAYLNSTGIAKRIRKFQAWLFLPLSYLFLMYEMHYERNIQYLIKEKANPTSGENFIWLCIISAGCLFCAYVLPFILLSPSHAVLLILIYNFIIGVRMVSVFAPNHKGMPQIEKGCKVSFLERQIVTARNVNPSWWIDLLYVGLNYQIEHHLFANCPRNKLKLLVPHVKALCARLNLPYLSVSPLHSLQIIVNELDEVSKECEQELKAKLPAPKEAVRLRL